VARLKGKPAACGTDWPAVSLISGRAWIDRVGHSAMVSRALSLVGARMSRAVSEPIVEYADAGRWSRPDLGTAGTSRSLRNGLIDMAKP
jgi:hypothetical protein